jgi:hypothetical protein
MNKEFVPYEQAVALKQLGFDKPCFAIYEDQKWQLVENKNACSYELCLTTDTFPAPTFSQAFRWFRRKYNLNAISPTRIYKTDFYYSRIVNWNNWDEIDVNQCDSYEEAELACLEKLIQIVKEA